MAVKKKSRQIATPSRARKKKADRKSGFRTVEWAAVGVDVSMASISLAGIAKTSEGKIRTGAVSLRWSHGTDYFERLKSAAKCHDLVHDLFIEMKVMAELNEIYFAVEEAVAISYIKRGESGWVKQQLQLSGALLGGLVRYGYVNIVEIQANQWRKIVADDLGITIHTSKWNDESYLSLPESFPKPLKGQVGKYRAWQWIVEQHPQWDGHWPDIIKTSKGQISRPEKSKAQGVQSDDRYECFAMAQWMRKELKNYAQM